jgi:hypothetical protein
MLLRNAAKTFGLQMGPRYAHLPNRHTVTLMAFCRTDSSERKNHSEKITEKITPKKSLRAFEKGV